METLFRIAYCSRNRIPATSLASQLHAILDVARRKNPRLGVTGALLYNDGSFAQLLEGPLASVEQIFESIQRDPRHSDVVVITSGPIEARTFPEWSMAFAGRRDLSSHAEAAQAFEHAFAGDTDGGQALLQLLREMVVDDGEWAPLASTR